MYDSLADLTPGNSAFFLVNISTIIGCKEIKFSKITIVNQLFQLHSFFYKNVVFPAQAEYSYFSADFRLKIFL